MSSLANAFDPVLIRASAGSGKTFALSNRFIALLAHGERPERILATTFTRKAAGEILERVYQRLSDAALDDSAAKALGRFIGKPGLTSREAAEILLRLVRSQSRLKVCTLDSFFISVAQSFSFELGLTPGWSLAESDGEELILLEALGNLFQSVEPERLSWLLYYLHKGDTKTAVHTQLQRHIVDLYASWKITTESAWKWLKVPKGLSDEQLAACLDAISRLEAPPTNSGKPDSNWQKALIRAADAVRERNWEELISSGLCAKILDGESTFYKRDITTEHRKAFEPLKEHLQAYFLGRLREQNEATYEFLSLFEKEFSAARAASQALNFDLIKYEIASARILGALEEVYYRLDSRIAHVLLDEFQDTSREEWLILEPIVAEILSKSGVENSFFCVGDTKQAIYGWRGGAAEIFDTLEARFPILSEALERRDESYRSSPVVIDAVNTVFSDIASAACLSDYTAVAAHWGERFSPHTTAKADFPGYVELRALGGDGPAAETKSLIFAAAAELVRDLARARPELSIAVLVRKNDSVNPMLDELWRHGVRGSGEGGNPLTDSWYVCLILSALRLSEHPADQISAFVLANSELGKLLEIEAQAPASALERVGVKIRRAVALHGLGEALRSWVAHLSIHAPDHDRRRMRQLCELAFGYPCSRMRRLSDFVLWIEKTKVENPAASNIRVMTIHRSKGLEFDAVILPELDEPVPALIPPRTLSFRESAVAAPRRISRYADSSIRRLSPELTEMYEQGRAREVEEALSVLYVAMTRARHGLFMLTSGAEKKSLSYGALLKERLFRPTAREDGTLYTEGTRDFWKAIKRQSAAPIASESNPRQSIELAPSALGRRRGLLKPLRADEMRNATQVDLAMHLRLDPEESAFKASVFREVCDALDWINGKLPSRESILELLPRRPRDVIRTLEAIDEFRKILGKPDVAELFKEPALPAGETNVILRNIPVAFRGKDGAIVSASIDRLVAYYRDGKGVGAHLLRFDTAEYTETEAQARVAAAKAHAGAYRTAAAQVIQTDASNVSFTLVLLRLGKVIHV